MVEGLRVPMIIGCCPGPYAPGGAAHGKEVLGEGPDKA